MKYFAVLAFCLLFYNVQSYQVGMLFIKFQKFVNWKGTGANGHCCDGRLGFCQDNGCDHKFHLCLTESGSPKTCKLKDIWTHAINNQNTNYFSKSFGGVPQPIEVRLPRANVIMSLDVWDRDTFTDDDFVDNIKKVFQPQHWSSTGTLRSSCVPDNGKDLPHHWVKHILPGHVKQQNTSMELQVLCRCNTNYYGARCEVFCQRPDVGDTYSCDPWTGRRICNKGWSGQKCQIPDSRVICTDESCTSSERGDCEENDNDYVTCTCKYPYYGERCEYVHKTTSKPSSKAPTSAIPSTVKASPTQPKGTRAPTTIATEKTTKRPTSTVIPSTKSATTVKAPTTPQAKTTQKPTTKAVPTTVRPSTKASTAKPTTNAATTQKPSTAQPTTKPPQSTAQPSQEPSKPPTRKTTPETPSTASPNSTLPSWKDRKNADCDRIAMNGKRYQDGVYKIQPSILDPFPVYCDMSRVGWTYIQRRVDGAVNFFRDWEQYKHGFGKPGATSEHWIGLEKIYHLTNQRNYQLNIAMQLGNGAWRYANYKRFWIDGEDDDYRLHVQGYSGTAGDALRYSGLGLRRMHNGMPFSTYDRDNDRQEDNCAEKYQGGWWYNSCYWADLNGGYVTNNRGGWPKCGHACCCVSWRSIRGYENYSLKQVIMKILPNPRF